MGTVCSPVCAKGGPLLSFDLGNPYSLIHIKRTMGHEEKLEQAFDSVVKLIHAYDSYQKTNPTFIPKRDKTWKVIPTAAKVEKSLKNFIGTKNKRRKYWKNMANLASIWYDESIYQSPPNAFMYAYRNLVGTNIVTSDMIRIREMGGNIIPLDYTVRDTAPKTAHTVFRTHGLGFRHYPKNESTTNVLRAGVSTGKYNDTSQMEAIFYDTAIDNPGPKSVAQCRYLEALSEELFENSDSGLILQVVAQLNVNNSHPVEEFSTAMVFSFCEVIPISKWDKELYDRELEIYGDELLFPLLLKPLSAKVAREKIGLIQDIGKEIDSVQDPYEIRTTLLDFNSIKKWNYKSIQSTKSVRKELLEHIKRHSPKCAHHDDDCTKKCSGMTEKNFHVGHIVSQSWSKSYRVFQESVHHPDNLYLCCSSCNESLGKGGPSRKVLQYLNDNFLTVGDLIRKKYLS
jgi:phage-related protein